MLAYKDHLALMARYNQMMNGKMIALVEPLPYAALLEDRGAFFGSILGTMNHLLVADLIWLRRIRPHAFGAGLAAIDDLPRPSALNDLPYPSLDAYRPVRERLDQTFIDFVANLSDDDVAAPLSYQNSSGKPFTRTLGLVLSHVFNHQTHHRGQITTLLNQAGLDIGVTDLIAIVPEVQA